MKILYLSGREITYSRNRIILNILKKNHQVKICTTNFKSYPVRIFTTFFKFLYFNCRYKKDLIFIGSIGPTFVPFVKLLTSKKIVFDSYLSTYNTLVEDRKIIKNFFLKKFILYYEKIACMCADLVLMDTYQHINYMKWRCKLKSNKFRRLLIGVDDTLFKKRIAPKKSKICNVYFHGGFVPLQGVEYIIGSANILKNEDIMFHIIGEGQTYKKCRKIAKKFNLQNIVFYGNRNFDEIPSFLSKADIGLGVFGNTLKTKLVIPNKVYELAALGMPIITAKTPAIDEIFVHNKDLILCNPADSNDLAKTILSIKNKEKLKKELSENVYQLCHNTFSINALAINLNNYIGELFTKQA